ncbi:unnamed protein product [Calypogeia fissa]
MAPSVDTGKESKKTGRALAATEANWVRATATGTGVQVIGIALKRHVELKLISQAAREVEGNYAILRSQIVETSKGKLALSAPQRPGVPPVEEFPWPPLGKKRMTGGMLVLPGDDTEDHRLSLALDSVVKQELNTPFRNASHKISGPVDVFRILVYTEHQEPTLGTLIVLKFNSGALDRPSAINISQSFFTALNAVVDGKVPMLPVAPGKNDLLPALEDLIPKGKAIKSLIQKGIDTITYAMSANKFSLLPFSSAYVESKHQVFRTDLLSYTLGKEGTAALMARSKQEKTTYGAALTAAFLKGVATVKELKDKNLDKFSFTSLMDCRPHFQPTIAPQGLGAYTTGISQDEQVRSDRGFWDLARSISASTEREMGKMIHFSELPVLNMIFSQILKRPGLTQKSSLRTALFSLFVDGPMNAQWKDVDKLDLAGTFGPYGSTHGIGPCFCVAEALVPGPELNLSLVYAVPVYDKDQMEALAQTSLEVLTAAIKEL